MNPRNCFDRPPDKRSSNGTPLYESPCPDCGIVRFLDKRRIGARCRSCSGKNSETHGLSKTAVYKLYKGIIARCKYPSATNYEYYGGRGIKVCKEWDGKPDVFAEWAIKNGWRRGLEIDRIDNNGDYSPGNCHFVTHIANSQKRSNGKCNIDQAKEVKRLLAQGRKVKDAAEEAGIPYMSAWHISKGNTWRNA